MSRRLKPNERAEIFAALRVRRRLTNKALCVRYGINRRTISRMEAEMSHFGTSAHGLSWWNVLETEAKS